MDHLINGNVYNMKSRRNDIKLVCEISKDIYERYSSYQEIHLYSNN